MNHPLKPFFNPRGVALLGTSASPNKLSHGVLRNMVDGGYQGGIYPVNPRYSDVLGLTCYPDIASVPDPVDLAVVILPAPNVPQILEDCGKRGIKAVTVLSGGFREVGAEGRQLEDQCVEIARKHGIRLVGPNCVGTMDLYSGLNTTFINGVPDPGAIGFLSQSGAICGAIIDYVRNRGIGFSNFVSLGNMADISETDMIEYLDQDENTRVIALYLEGLTDGRRFLEIASKVSRHKPIVVLKSGRSEAGARAVSSHTGSLAGAHTAYETAFRQAGVIAVDTAEELFDVCAGLVFQPLPRGNRVVLVTNSGGPAALASDSLAASGMTLANLSDASRQTLRQALAPSAQVANPVDMLGGAEPHEFETALRTSLADPGVDAAIAILTPTALVDPAEVAQTVGQVSSEFEKTVLACFVGGDAVNESRRILHKLNIPMYHFPEPAGRVLGKMRQYALQNTHMTSQGSHVNHPGKPAAEEMFDGLSGRGHLEEASVRPLLTAYGIPVVPGATAHSPQEAGKIAAQIGFPVVLKVVSADVLHKSDSGGILLNLPDPGSVEEGYQFVIDRVQKNVPNAKIDGVLVEKMAARGIEVILGMKRDPAFGPLMMFGLGGIFVELFNDVSFGIAPLAQEEAADMIERTRAGKLLHGLRGQAPSDIQAVVDVLINLSQLALDFPNLQEIEINPLLVYPEGQGVLALDARAIQ